jgi:hypothetical protein
VAEKTTNRRLNKTIIAETNDLNQDEAGRQHIFVLTSQHRRPYEDK